MNIKKQNNRKEFTKSQNLLRMLISIARNPYRTPSEISKDIGVPKATYYRYFDELSQIIPVFYDNTKKRFEFAKTLTIKNIIRFSDEFYIFLLILQAFRNTNFISTDNIAEKMEKFDVIDEEIRHCAQCYFLLYESGLPATDMGEKLYKICCAIIGRRRLSFQYISNKDSYTVKVDPYRVVMDDFWYLYTYSHKRSADRTFKISRISNIEILDEKFIMPDPESLDIGRISINWDFDGDYPVRVVLEFEKTVCMSIKERFFHKTQKITELADGRVRMKVDVRNPSNMVNWILGFGQFVTIIEPQILKAQLAERLKEISKKYTAEKTKEKR